MEDYKTFFSKAYDDYADAIFRYCYYKLSDRDAAKDATQEIFLKIWNYLDSGKNIQSFKSFLYVTAANHVKDQWKKKKAIPISVLDNEEHSFDVADPASSFENKIEFGLAVDLLNRVGEKDREILLLRFVEGLSITEISEILKIRENATSVRINRALARLKSIIEKNGQ